MIRDGESSSTSKPMACSGGSSSPALATEPFSAGRRRVASSSMARATGKVCRGVVGSCSYLPPAGGRCAWKWNLWACASGSASASDRPIVGLSGEPSLFVS